MAMEGADKERNTLFLVKHTHIHNTRPFNKTHFLMFAMEREDKERNRLLLVKHAHKQNTRSFSETHSLILAMKGADKERKGYFWSNSHKYTKQEYSVKLTA